MATTTAADELLEGITTKTTKEDLTIRLRKAVTLARKTERQKMTRLQEIEERLRAQVTDVPNDELRQVIINGSTDDWREMEKFLSEFHTPEPTLLPPALQRILVGARVMLGDVNDGNG